MIATMKNKYIIHSRILGEKISLNVIFSTSLMLVALQEVWILKPLKYQNSPTFQRLRYVKSLNKLES